eukprot:ctg_194.g130
MGCSALRARTTGIRQSAERERQSLQWPTRQASSHGVGELLQQCRRVSSTLSGLLGAAVTGPGGDAYAAAGRAVRAYPRPALAHACRVHDRRTPLGVGIFRTCTPRLAGITLTGVLHTVIPSG